jgi:hypothetical protein
MRKKWLMTHFNDYLDVKNRPYRLSVGSGQITRQKSDPILNPWDYAPNDSEGMNIWGVISIPYPDKPSWWPWTQKIPIPEDDYFAFLAGMNWFVNGNKTPGGKPGLNPRELFGGHREINEDSFTCTNGIYTPRSIRYGKPARFAWKDNRKKDWIGDDVIPYIPTWTN